MFFGEKMIENFGGLFLACKFQAKSKKKLQNFSI